MIYTDKIHMVADSLEELHQFAQKIGLSRAYFEGTMKKHPHYDLVNEKKKPLYDLFGKKFMDKAIENGAVVVRDRKILEISKKLIKKK